MKRPYCSIASSSASSKPQTNYDVFLSFRGETSNGFSSHLHKALDQEGIHTFLDVDKLEKGNAISEELLKAIEGSRCSVVILSGDYASSRWCLDELVKILQCMKDLKQTVLPIFYHVDPSHVRKQIGSIGEAFERHEQVFSRNMEKVRSWRAALTEVGNLAGYHLQDDGNEAKFIDDFMKVVSSKLDVAMLNISRDLVGMDSRLHELNLCVSKSSFEDVRFIGISGMGGLGKTTLARAYFNKYMSYFEASSFLANIREVCEEKKNGLVKLQEQLLSDILKGKHEIRNVYHGTVTIKKRLCRKKVLVILDDVNQLNQIKGLAEENNWFGSGSIIILTTRDESLLSSTYREEEYVIHKVDILEYGEAIQLFSWKAFKSDCPLEDYIELSEEVMKYANGLPLALEVMGSFLRRKSTEEWKSALDRLKEEPEKGIMEVLRISFDGLKESEKNIFLDIACFFNGYPKDYVMKIMDICGFFPEIGIRSLVDKSLLILHTAHDGKRLRMHDLLEEMGKLIARGKSRNEPGRQSRIWHENDFIHVSRNNKGAEEVEAIVCNSLNLEKRYRFSGLSHMKELRLLIIFETVENRKRDIKWQHFGYLSNELRFLVWNNFPFKYFPASFQPHGLVELSLYKSNIEQLWINCMKPLYNLKSIDLSCSENIEKLENFCLFPNLEKLNLDHCSRLMLIHPSIRVLKRLTFLSLQFCVSLRSLPSMDGLESLKLLKLFNCSSLGNLPEGLECLNNLEKLDVRDTDIRDIPSSIGDLKALESLYCSEIRLGPHGWKDVFNTIVGKGPSSSAGLYCLTKLRLIKCNLHEGVLPNDFGCFVSLEHLDISYSYFSCLPASVNQLSKLRYLDLRHCRKLTSLGPELPDSLELVRVDYCRKLHTFLDPLSQCNLRCSAICVECFDLVDNQGSKRTAMTSLGRYLHQGNPPSPSKRFDIVLPGDEIPSWFTHQVRRSTSISLPLHPNWCNTKWMGFALSVCFKIDSAHFSFYWEIKINEEDWGFGHVCSLRNNHFEDNHHVWLLYMPRETYSHTKWQNMLSAQIEFSFKKQDSGEECKEFKQCGVRLVCEQDMEELDLTARHEPIEPMTILTRKFSAIHYYDEDEEEIEDEDKY